MTILKVLVVDDEPGIRSGVNRIMRNFHVDYPFMDEHVSFEVLEAESGEAGIEIIETDMPDIMLLDNKLPGIQGIEVLEYVRKHNYNIVVVMITSYASLDLAVNATRHGAHDFIPKPFTPQELRSSLENITKKIFLKKMTKEMGDEGRQIRFRFLSVLSHELKAPLNAIEGYLNMINEKQFGEHIADYDQIINRSLDRVKGMRTLILDMLDLTRIETEEKKRTMVNCNLVTIAKSAIDTMKPLAIQMDIDLQLISNDTIPILADCTEMEIIFNNLISNAVKYNKQNGIVKCELASTNDHVTIIVTDSGIGMNASDINTIYDDFVRIKNEKTRKISGSGLGLSIVKNLVNKYQGKITLESVPDTGSVFTVTLPTN